jgi:hypothetical protein
MANHGVENDALIGRRTIICMPLIAALAII